MWREELLVRLDVDPHDFPIVVIGNKVSVTHTAVRVPRFWNVLSPFSMLRKIRSRPRV